MAGLFDFCVFVSLFGVPMSGSKIRAGKEGITCHSQSTHFQIGNGCLHY
jgi:hypothetical protein